MGHSLQTLAKELVMLEKYPEDQLKSVLHSHITQGDIPSHAVDLKKA